MRKSQIIFAQNVEKNFTRKVTLRPITESTLVKNLTNAPGKAVMKLVSAKVISIFTLENFIKRADKTCMIDKKICF